MPPLNEWTIMFQLAGDSAISAPMIAQLKEITDAGFQEKTNVLVYFDPNCNGKSARIFDVNAKRKKRSTKQKTVIGDGEDPFVRNIDEDCHRPALNQIPATLSLRFFLEYCRTYYPAKNYLLFLMGHGVIVGNDAFLPDPDDASAITLKDLGRVLRGFADKVRAEKQEFHLVGFHSCSMSSVELAYELQGSARYMVGTQGTAFPGSWPYRQLLKKIFAVINGNGNGPLSDSGAYPTELVREILRGVQEFSFYNSVDFLLAGFSSDISMCNLDEKPLKTLDPKLERLAIELRNGLSDEATKGCILRAHLESQSYFGERYTDLYDFCDRLSEHCQEKTGSQPAIANACKAVMRVLKANRTETSHRPEGAFDELVVFSDYYGPSYQFSNGLSIFFPWRAPAGDILGTYAQYRFSEPGNAGSEWLAFLNEYFIATERKARKAQEIPSMAKADVSKVLRLPGKTDFFSTVPDDKLLKLGTRPDGSLVPADKQGGGLEIIISDKEGGGLLVVPSDKQGGGLAIIPSDKQGGGLEIVPSDKQGGGLAIIASDKPGGGIEIVPSDKQGGSLAIVPSDKQGGALAIMPSDKQGGTLAIISDKQSGTLAIVSDKQNGSLGSISDAQGFLGMISDKQGGTLAIISDKQAGTLAGGGSDKQSGTLDEGSDKQAGTVGLGGVTVIKNFQDPEDAVITSRPRTHHHKRRAAAKE